MNTSIPFLLACLALSPVLHAAGPVPATEAGTPANAAVEVRPGDSEESLRVRLGAYRGRLETGEGTLYVYPCGEVLVRDGKVVRATLRSAEEIAAQAAVREKARAEALERAKTQEESRMAEALRTRDRLRKDAALLTRPATERLETWRRFAAANPDIDCTDDVRAIQEEIRITASAERLADIERRLAAAETSERQLREENDRLRRELANARYEAARWQSRAIDAEKDSSYHGSYGPVIITPQPRPPVIITTPTTPRPPAKVPRSKVVVPAAPKVVAPTTTTPKVVAPPTVPATPAASS